MLIESHHCQPQHLLELPDPKLDAAMGWVVTAYSRRRKRHVLFSLRPTSTAERYPTWDTETAALDFAKYLDPKFYCNIRVHRLELK